MGMDIKAILIACLVGAIAMVAILAPITHFAGDEYNANLTASTRGNLTLLSDKLDDTTGQVVQIRQNLNNTAVTQGDVTTAQGTDITGISTWSLALSTLNLMFTLPDTIQTFAVIVLNILPFNLGYVIAGLVAIVGAIVAFEIIDSILRR
jgi:hypothetical protein